MNKIKDKIQINFTSENLYNAVKKVESFSLPNKDDSYYFTNDIKDISSAEFRKIYKFEIEDIDCKVNEAFGAEKARE